MPDPAPTASEYFGAMVDRYDSLIRRAVPRYDEMIDRLVDFLPRTAPRTLELGCGTGNLTLRLLQRDPLATVTTVDAASEMTAITARRAAAIDAGARLRTLTARFEELNFPAASFDLVTSCMSLHHVRDRAPLYRSLRAWLAPGGAFCFADQLLGATDDIQRVMWERWLEFCRLPGHCTADEIKSLTDHAAAHDHYEPLSAHLDTLRAAGFSMVDCVWRNHMYTVIVAA